ncbi:MAG: putative membrane protein [Cyclobacteriaceae bacterium]|jgi:putative membrane protein
MESNRNALISIISVSVVIPVAVGILLFSPYKISSESSWIPMLPSFNAIINGLTAILLLMARYFISIDKRNWHKWFMEISFVLGACFLVSYIIYHSNVPSVSYGDANGDGVLEEMELAQIGKWRIFYLILLLSHIGLSIVVVPFVLFAFYFALCENFEKHLKIVKYTWPIWFYVCVSGVLVYFMISPYYG